MGFNDLKAFFLRSLIVIICVSVSGVLNAVSWSPISWDMLETTHFRTLYPSQYDLKARQIIRELEANRESVIQWVGDQSPKPVVFLQDQGLLANAYSAPIETKLGFYTYTPPSNSRLGHFWNWNRLVGVHELTHQYQASNVSGQSRLVNQIFGWINSPHLVLPIWLLEGIAVNSESSITPYEGRLNDGYFRYITRLHIHTNQLTHIQQLLPVNFRYPLDHSYAYGSVFLSYLSSTYSQDHIRQFVTHYGQTVNHMVISPIYAMFPYTALDKSAKHVFGKRFDELFDDWLTYEQSIPMVQSPQPPITKSDWMQSNLGVWTNKLVTTQRMMTSAAQESSIALSRVVVVDPVSQSTRVVRSFNQPVLSQYDLTGDSYAIALNETSFGFENTENAGFGSEYRLVDINLKTGDMADIYQGPIRTFCRLDDQDWIIVDDLVSGGSRIRRKVNDEWTELWQGSLIISELVCESKSQWFAVAKNDNTSWDIYEIDAQMTGDFRQLTNTPYREFNLRQNGSSLVYVSNANGQYHLYSQSVKSGVRTQVTKDPFVLEGVVKEGVVYAIQVSQTGETITSLPGLQISFDDSPIIENNLSAPKVDFAKPSTTKKWTYIAKSWGVPVVRDPLIVRGTDPIRLLDYQVSLFSTTLSTPSSSYGLPGTSFSIKSLGFPPFQPSIQYTSKYGLGAQLFYSMHRQKSVGWTHIQPNIGMNSSRQVLLGVDSKYRKLDWMVQSNILFNAAIQRFNVYAIGSKYLTNSMIHAFAGTSSQWQMMHDFYQARQVSITYSQLLMKKSWMSWRFNSLIQDIYSETSAGLFFDQKTVGFFSAGLKVPISVGMDTARWYAYLGMNLAEGNTYPVLRLSSSFN